MSDSPQAPEQPDVVDNEVASRFEVTIDGRTAELTYRREGNLLVLVHTGVPDELEGRGLGGALVRAAVDRAVADQLPVVAECSFARDWLERHPDSAARITVS